MAGDTITSPRALLALKSSTSPEWLTLALERFDEVLGDHAHCEKKAAVNALSLLQAYPEVQGLAVQMARLAREETAHLSRVLAIMEQRRVLLRRDTGDPYVQALQGLIRTSALERRLDRLLVAAVVEARSCERLALLADGLGGLPIPEAEALQRFYRELAQSENGHHALFVRLAVESHGERERDRPSARSVTGKGGGDRLPPPAPARNPLNLPVAGDVDALAL